MKTFRIAICIASMLVAALAASEAVALTRGFEASSFRPAVDDGPYITVYGSETLGRRQWVFGSTVNYAYRPFQLIENGVRVRGIIDHALQQNFYGSVGLAERWLQLGVDMPVAWWLSYTDPNVAAASSQNKTALGDIQINLKSELLQIKKHRIGIAILPFITLPTGKGEYFTGNGGVAGGGRLIVEARPVERWGIALNAGVMARQKFTILDIEQTHQLLFGLGTSVDVTENLSASAEVWGRAKMSDLFGTRRESPVEADAGLKYRIRDTGLAVNAGGGAGLLKGSGAPTFRAFLGLSWRSPLRERVVAAPPDLDFIRNAVVNFPFNSMHISASEDMETLMRIADIMRGAESVNINAVGYTDSTGPASVNQRLSGKRAETVKVLITDRGVEPARIETEGRGPADPAADNATTEGRARNRRVEFELLN